MELFSQMSLLSQISTELYNESMAVVRYDTATWKRPEKVAEMSWVKEVLLAQCARWVQLKELLKVYPEVAHFQNCLVCGDKITEWGEERNEAQDIPGYGPVCCTEHGNLLLHLVGCDGWLECDWCGKIFFDEAWERSIPAGWHEPPEGAGTYCSAEHAQDHDESLREDYD